MINSRALLVILVVFIVLVILIGKLFTIQVTEHEKFTRIAARQQNKSVKIKAERGTITDRNDELLAFTKNDVSLFVDTRMTDKNEKERIAVKFSQVFNKSKNHYLNLLNSGNKNILIEKKAYKDKVMKLVSIGAVLILALSAGQAAAYTVDLGSSSGFYAGPATSKYMLFWH